MKLNRHAIKWNLLLLFLLIVSLNVPALDWQEGPRMPYPIMNGAAVAANGRVYIFGGYSGGLTAPDIKNSIISAPINPDGSLGEFTMEAVRMHSPRAGHGIAVYQDKIFILGGYDASVFSIRSDNWMFQILEDGHLGPGTVISTTLPNDGSYSLGDCFGRVNLAHQNHLYISSGEMSNSGVFPNIKHVYSTTFTNNGLSSDWQVSTFTNPIIDPETQEPGIWNAATAIVEGLEDIFIFQIGGGFHPNAGNFTPRGSTNQVAKAVVNPSSGEVNSWTLAKPLPVRKKGAVALTNLGSIFVVGGSANNQPFDKNVYIGRVNLNSGDLDWQIDEDELPYNSRVPMGATWKDQNGDVWLGVFGGHESESSFSYIAKADTAKPGTITIRPVVLTDTRPSFNPQSVGLSIPGFHTPAEAQSLIAGPPVRPHVLLFTATDNRDGVRQNVILSNPEFLPMTEQAVFVWINVRENTSMARNVNIMKLPTWIFYDAKGTERDRTIGVMNLDEIKTRLNLIK